MLPLRVSAVKKKPLKAPMLTLEENKKDGSVGPVENECVPGENTKLY